MPNAYYTRPAIIPPGPSIAYLELTQGQYARIDRERAEELSQWNWYAHWEPSCSAFYAWRKESRTRKVISLQAQILGLSGHEITGDHLDRNPLNNMDYNLRAATQSQQMMNQGRSRSVAPAPKSGRDGILWSRDRNKWHVTVGAGKRWKHVGWYSQLSDAIAGQENAYAMVNMRGGMKTLYVEEMSLREFLGVGE